MSEVKLPSPVKAQHIDDWPDEPPAGAFTFSVDHSGKRCGLIYNCPCGCNQQGCLRLRPTTETGPSWEFSGNTDRPTLSPSINHVGHWHGYLRDGFWVNA